MLSVRKFVALAVSPALLLVMSCGRHSQSEVYYLVAANLSLPYWKTAIAGFTAAGMDEPFSPAIDGAGNLWTANFANNSVTVFIGIAAPVRTPVIGPPASP